MIADPRFAPRRADLTWMRRRRLPKSAVTPAPAPLASSARTAVTASTAPAAPLREFLTGHDTHRQHEEPASPPPQPTRRPQPAPAASSSLDLDEPSAPPAAPARASSSLDLGEPSAPPAAPARASSSLNLDEPSAPPVPASSLDLDDRPAARPAPPAAPTRRRRVDVRVGAGQRLLLSPSEPTVTLTPLQSGIGTLVVEAAASAEVGDLRLGALYQLDSGFEMTVQMSQGNRFAPPHSKRPVIVGGRERFERLSFDLRQVRGLRRAVIYAFSEGRRPLAWGGTLVVTTYGGGRIELPLDPLQGGDSAVLLSAYQVRGELVLRAEMQALFGDVRACARAYGFDKITWLDDRTPVE